VVQIVALRLAPETESGSPLLRAQQSRLSVVNDDSHLVPKLGVLVVNVDEKVTPLLPPLRRLSGVAVAGVVAEAALESALPGDSVALQVERLGQLQFLVIGIQ